MLKGTVASFGGANCCDLNTKGVRPYLDDTCSYVTLAIGRTVLSHILIGLHGPPFCSSFQEGSLAQPILLRACTIAFLLDRCSVVSEWTSEMELGCFVRS